MDRTSIEEESDLAELEEDPVRAAIARQKNNMSSGAQELGIDRSTLWRRWKRLDWSYGPTRRGGSGHHPRRRPSPGL